MTKEFEKNLTLVIGGSGDIGIKVVERLLKRGGRVLATYNKNKDSLEKTFFEKSRIKKGCSKTIDNKRMQPVLKNIFTLIHEFELVSE